MRRHPLLDPPEYVEWRPDAARTAEYIACLERDEERRSIVESLGEATKLGLYEGLLRARLHDHALKRWVRRGVISKAWLGTGEEAVTVGSVHALRRGQDVVAPMIRNAAAVHEMGVPLDAMFAAYLGTVDTRAAGRDLHVGELGAGVIQPISPVGAMVPVVAGVALAFQRRSEPRVALTWIGDGATKTGAVHEGLNLAAVLRVPAVFVLQNNQVALGTRLDQHQIDGFGDWPAMYGLPGLSADGNNVLDVYAATRIAVERARAGGGPSLLLVETFRMGGHATHDEAEARATFPAELFAQWGRRDPIGCYEAFLTATGIAADALDAIEARVEAEVDAAAERALENRASRMPPPGSAAFTGFTAAVRQPGLAARLPR